MTMDWLVGGVEFDGRGTLIAHESSWLNDNRNRGSREAVGKLLLEAFGGEKVVWAPGVKGVDITGTISILWQGSSNLEPS